MARTGRFQPPDTQGDAITALRLRGLPLRYRALRWLPARLGWLRTRSRRQRWLMWHGTDSPHRPPERPATERWPATSGGSLELPPCCTGKTLGVPFIDEDRCRGSPGPYLRSVPTGPTPALHRTWKLAGPATRCVSAVRPCVSFQQIYVVGLGLAAVAGAWTNRSPRLRHQSRTSQLGAQRNPGPRPPPALPLGQRPSSLVHNAGRRSTRRGRHRGSGPFGVQQVRQSATSSSLLPH